MVIVIDDDREVREAMALVLSDWGCRVIAVTTVDEAIASIADLSKHPDLVIADYRLGGGANGIDAVNTIRRMVGTTVPAVLVTGDTGADRLREVRDSSLTLLHKPVVVAQLYETLSRAVTTQ